MNFTKMITFVIMIISTSTKPLTYSNALLLRKLKNAIRRGQNSRKTLAGLIH